MEVIYVVLPLGLLIGGGFLYACVSAIRRGQFDDLDTPPVRMLLDDVPVNDDVPLNDDVPVNDDVAVNDDDC